MLAPDYKNLSLQDALDVAVLVEEEARDRYLELAKVVGGRYAGDASDMFRMMAQYEERHGAEIAQRRQRIFGDAPRRMTREALFEVEAPSLSAPRTFMSARDALAVAYESEVKAYEFFSDAIPHLADPDVRALFEELRHEELRHQQLVREKMDKLPSGPDVPDDEADQPGSDPGN